MMEDLKRNLLQGKYQEAEDICKSMDDNSLRDMIMTIAYDTENISVYCFIQYMIQRTGKASWVELAIDIMLNPLCFIEGAYSVALFHTRELLLIEKNVRNLERIIFFYNIPEKLVDEEDFSGALVLLKNSENVNWVEKYPSLQKWMMQVQNKLDFNAAIKQIANNSLAVMKINSIKKEINND